METNQYSKGSEWRRWDLHIHSDASDGTMSCEQIIAKAIENKIDVIALTDHHTVRNIDNIRTLAKDNPISIIAGVEFRTEYGDKSVHIIGLFPESYNDIELNTKNLEDLILNPLGLAEATIINKGKDKLTSENSSNINDISAFKRGIFEVQVDFKKAADKIHEFGGIVIPHAGTKENSIDKEMKHEGKPGVDLYNSLGPVKEELFNKGYIDICEIRKEKDSDSFYLDKFNRPSIISSDAHSLNEVGSKFTWIKADPSFYGLKQLLNEPKDRVFIGIEPEILKQVRNNPTKYIKSLSVNKVNGYDNKSGIWFDNVNISINPELVAIIGNKGKGKSALADVVGLCANSKLSEFFQFLHKDKFRHKKLAENFEGSISFESGLCLTRNLNTSIEDSEIPYVKYLPQGYFERLCNEIGSSDNFQKEIENVVFQHLEEKERCNKNSFTELIEYKKKTISEELALLKSELIELNSSIIALEKKRNTGYLTNIENQILRKKQELEGHQNSKPDQIEDPNQNKEIEEKQKGTFDKISLLNQEIIKVKNEIEILCQTEITLNQEISDLTQIKESIEIKKKELDNYIERSKVSLSKYGLNINDLISITINTVEIESLLKAKNESITLIQKQLGTSETISKEDLQNSKATILNDLQGNHDKLQLQLDEPTQLYQKYLKELSDWNERQTQIIGDEETFDTLKYYESEKEYILTKLQPSLKEMRQTRLINVEKIYNKKNEIISIYKSIKGRIDSILDNNNTAIADYTIIIDASFELNMNFKENFFHYINRKSAGTFWSVEGSEKFLNKILENRDFNNFEYVKSFLNDLIDHFEYDKRDNSETSQLRNLEDQIKDLEGFYSFLFSLDYLKENYKLKLSDKELNQLSPGEKGALLLVFYLILDKDDKPLIIDQPEDNLDNQSVATILVPFIKKAKTHRQIIMVTHNPNLAVVADAEQIIHVNIEKENSNTFSFTSGSIENPGINKCIVDVLEGTMPAFDVRKTKYYGHKTGLK